jgi:hypothetical protein
LINWSYRGYWYSSTIGSGFAAACMKIASEIRTTTKAPTPAAAQL